MKGSEILKAVDHTLLKPTASWADIQALCEEAIVYKTASICIPPNYIARVQEVFGDNVKICTVIGFPLGYDEKETKIFAAKKALADGAEEIDMVVNLTDVKNGDFAKVTEEIAAMKEVVGDKILKVIVETCYLTRAEKIALCKAVTEGGADYIKTSTGFGTMGANHSDVRLFKEHIGPKVKIKAAGGIHSVEDMRMYLEEGCSRIGASSAVALLRDMLEEEV